jgi:hypothetical protein
MGMFKARIRMAVWMISTRHAHRSFDFGWLWAPGEGPCLIGTIGTFRNLSSVKQLNLDGKV